MAKVLKALSFEAGEIVMASDGRLIAWAQDRKGKTLAYRGKLADIQDQGRCPVHSCAREMGRAQGKLRPLGCEPEETGSSPFSPVPGSGWIERS
ncbi:MAG: hypothetical protein ABSE87_13590 [Terracidiphilus sp.]